ncbi:MAG TPA: hypothetical protein VLF67_02565 [Candidatus Saccharimonas sp.]|nr:hypothetical protein [Candidatus Saccharimonas sp.]
MDLTIPDRMHRQTATLTLLVWCGSTADQPTRPVEVDPYRFTVRGYRAVERCRTAGRNILDQPAQEDLAVLCRHQKRHDADTWHHLAAVDLKRSLQLGRQIRLGRRQLNLESTRTPRLFMGSLSGLTDSSAKRQELLETFRAGHRAPRWSGDERLQQKQGQALRWLALRPRIAVTTEELLAERSLTDQFIAALTGQPQPPLAD